MPLPGDARSSAKKKNERLYSLKPTPEGAFLGEYGGADPDARNGSHGVGYTWGQGPPDVTIYRARIARLLLRCSVTTALYRNYCAEVALQLGSNGPRLGAGVGKEDIEVQVRPTSLSLSYWTPPPPGNCPRP
eukprot:202931-Rhodomonas_salina.1